MRRFYRLTAVFGLALCVGWPAAASAVSPVPSARPTSRLNAATAPAPLPPAVGAAGASAPEAGGVVGPASGRPSPISRLQLLEEVSRAWGGRPWTEAEALQSGLLEPYADGKIHLDWPLSRGVAARVLARVVRRLDPAAGFPKAFSDVTASSPVGAALGIVGQAFRPVVGERFVADQIFSPDDLQFAMATLGRLIPASLTLPLVPGPASEDQSLDGLQVGRRIDLGFPEGPRGESSSSIGLALASDVQRLSRLAPLVPADQLAPQTQFDLEAAADGLAEMERALDSFELTIYDVTLADPKDRGLEAEIRDFLGQMKETLHNSREKLRLSRRQLQAALLVDPQSMERCAELRSRLEMALFRLENLAERVDKRLQAISPPGAAE